jgi:HEAT repeat protein
MIEQLIATAISGDPGLARDTARTLADPSLVEEFRAVLARKLSAIERKLAYEFLDYFARNSGSAEVAALLLERLGAEKSEPMQLEILGTLRLLHGLESRLIEPLLAPTRPRIRHAAIQALGACVDERSVDLLTDILRNSAGGEETRVCAEALARCGNEATADVLIDALDGLERVRQNMLAVLGLLVAISNVCGIRHRAWLHDELTWRADPIERWLLLIGLTRIGTSADCALVSAQVEAYLDQPTGPINLMTGHTPIPHRTSFQVGMAFLHRICRDEFEALAARAQAAKLPDEDLALLDTLH